ncbi:MAG: iron transporter [Calditrichaeota bacterium]|nr:MAG: iron transporter [Calditrichota bacterium]
MKTSRWMETLRVLGPGLAVAATGVGAGDMIAAAVAGARYGTVVIWAALVGALLKFALNEGIARWQLATGETLLEGWACRLNRWISILFVIYLALWGFIVAGALMAACGLAAHALMPALSVAQWGALHSVAAVGLVLAGRYHLFENMMKFFIGLMFAVIMYCAVRIQPDWGNLLASFCRPHIPAGAGKFLLGVIGGVGGSVTLLNYSYWIREKRWEGPAQAPTVRLDLGAGYLLTGLFGAAMIIIAAGVNPEVVGGNEMALAVARRLGEIAGVPGRWMFLVGFWGAVFSSMLGVWQGVPYMFADFMALRRSAGMVPVTPEANTRQYRVFLLYLALPPMLLLLVDRPVWVVIIYAVFGALFMPFLAGTLLYMNNRQDWVGRLKNGPVMNFLLMGALGVFAYLSITEIVEQVGKLITAG